jgi:hypothetical protein
MPAKKITIQAGQKGQGSFSAFLKKGEKPDDNKILAVLPSHLTPVSPMASTERSSAGPSEALTDPQIIGFMASLTPNERVAHKIAVEKLGTSYDIRRTHGFVRWLANSKTT